MKKALSVISLVLMLNLLGCAAMPVSPIIKERVLVAAFDSTWEATLEALREENFVIDSVDEGKGIIRTRTLKITGEVTKAISQGYNKTFGKPIEGTYDLSIKVRIKDEDRTSIRIDTRIKANFPRHGWYTKSSSGAIENRIFSNIMRRLEQDKLLHDWF
ncbi:MAG: hypothetical protein U9R31_01570 [Candidatus Omnitrophota bacterium]|nr:hypothetical protein [Candidatus Omnitrophota bacterium]